MGTVVFPCGCSITRSMFGDCDVIWVLVCFKHSLDNDIHKAQKNLFDITDGKEMPKNWQDPEVQEVLVSLADAVKVAVS